MALEYKRRGKQNLEKIRAQIVDQSPDSKDYFNITEIPSYLGPGKNSIRIKVSDKEALYVIKIDAEKNEITVGPREKLGKKDIVWEKDGFIDHRKLWITYEEVIDANAHKGPLQSEEGSRDTMGGGATG